MLYLSENISLFSLEFLYCFIDLTKVFKVNIVRSLNNVITVLESKYMVT